MVHKGKKRAVAPVNPQKKRKKKNIDCWDVMDIIGDGSNSGPAARAVTAGRNPSAAKRRLVFESSSGFPSDND